jgi:hypothetical protein
LALCNAFIEELIDFVEHRYAVPQQVIVNPRRHAHQVAAPAASQISRLYAEELGEDEQEYSTAYFAILIDVVLSRCRTKQWRIQG